MTTRCSKKVDVMKLLRNRKCHNVSIFKRLSVITMMIDDDRSGIDNLCTDGEMFKGKK